MRHFTLCINAPILIGWWLVNVESICAKWRWRKQTQKWKATKGTWWKESDERDKEPNKNLTELKALTVWEIGECCLLSDIRCFICFFFCQSSIIRWTWEGILFHSHSTHFHCCFYFILDISLFHMKSKIIRFAVGHWTKRVNYDYPLSTVTISEVFFLVNSNVEMLMLIQAIHWWANGELWMCWYDIHQISLNIEHSSV